MTTVAFDVARLFGYAVVLVGVAYPLGLYMAHVFAGERTWLTPVLAPVERLVYRVGGVASMLAQILCNGSTA